MGALDRFLRRGRLQDGGYKPLMKRLEAAMFAACRASGASAWYVPDDFLTLGPELVTNGKFDSALSGWTNNGALASIASDQGSNVLYLSQAGGATNISQAVSLDVGKSYQISFKRRGTAAGSGLSGRISFVYADATSSVSPATSATVRGEYELVADVLTPTKAVTSIRLIATTSSGDSVGTVNFDDVSIREILSAKDFQDSAGVLPSYLTGIVGLVGDVAGVPGPELIASPHVSGSWTAEGTTPPTAVNGADTYLGKPCRSVTFPAVASGGYSVCRARDAENIFNVLAGTTYSVSFEYALSRDLTAGESIAIAITGSSGLYAKSVSAGSPGGVWSYGSGGQPAVASGGGTGLRPYATVLNAPLTVFIRALSVKVSGGVVAVQSTAGNRPVISRIPRKLGPELVSSGDFSAATAGWSAGVASLANVAGELEVTSSGAVYGYGRQILSVEVGKTYQVKGKGRLGTANLAWILAGTGGDALAYTGTTLSINSATPMVRSATFVARETSLVLTLENNNAVANGTAYFDDISVREVIEWGYTITFDGSNDSLAAPASIIGTNLSQPYTMIAWGRVGAVGAARAMQGDAARWIGISSSGKAIASNSGTASQIGTTTLQQGAGAIIEAVWDGAAMSVYLNGTREVNQVPTGAPITAASAHSVGQAGSAVNFWNDALGGAVVCAAVMTDAQRLAVRKFAAAQMGLVL